MGQSFLDRQYIKSKRPVWDHCEDVGAGGAGVDQEVCTKYKS